MARYQSNGYINSLYQTQYIMVGDVKMTVKEFKAMQKANAKKKKTSKKVTSITILPSEIKEMMRNVKVLKSLVAYHTHGYRQWGTIANLLMGLREIKPHFNNVVINTKQTIRLIEKINKIAKENDKDVFQYVKKLSWKLDDVKNELDELVKGINSSGVCHQFGTHECINGTGRRLGLRILTQRSYKAISDLGYICAKLDSIEQEGMNVFEYHTNGKQIKN